MLNAQSHAARHDPAADAHDALAAEPRHRLRRRNRISAPHSRIAYSLGISMVCALAAIDLVTGGPAPATADEQSSVSVADALGIEGAGIEVSPVEDAAMLEQLAASRAQRDGEQAQAAAAQAQAEQAALEAKAAEEARLAAEAAAAVEAAAAAEAAKAAAEAAKQAEAPETATGVAAAASTAVSAIARISNSSGAVRPQTQAAADAVVSNVPGADSITIGGTRSSAADPGGHPSGLALDHMRNPSRGDAIAEYHIAHWDEPGVEYIVWQQRMLNSPGGVWKTMENRGSPTANHHDDVHLNYR